MSAEGVKWKHVSPYLQMSLSLQLGGACSCFFWHNIKERKVNRSRWTERTYTHTEQIDVIGIQLWLGHKSPWLTTKAQSNCERRMTQAFVEDVLHWETLHCKAKLTYFLITFCILVSFVSLLYNPLILGCVANISGAVLHINMHPWGGSSYWKLLIGWEWRNKVIRQKLLGAGVNVRAALLCIA